MGNDADIRCIQRTKTTLCLQEISLHNNSVGLNNARDAQQSCSELETAFPFSSKIMRPCNNKLQHISCWSFMGLLTLVFDLLSLDLKMNE